jgi:demethylmenaquinone methyltransferase/2-methoxy-6-polyprenyl-1,4-benzoquinol methylase
MTKANESETDILRVLTTRHETRAFYDKIAGVYDLLSEKSEQPIRRFGLERLEVRTGERVLEIGFGTGSSLLELAERVGLKGKVFGVDLADKMTEVARRKLKDHDLLDRVQLIGADASSLPFMSESIDAIFMSFTLELFDTPEIPAVLGECKRVLRPGGRMVVVSITKKGRAGAMRQIFEWTHEHFPNFLDCRPIFVQQELLAAGFEIKSADVKSMWVPVAIVLGCKV